MDTDYTAENYVVNANEYELVYFMDANDNEIMAYAINNTDTAMEVKDCLIGGVSVDDLSLIHIFYRFVQIQDVDVIVKKCKFHSDVLLWKYNLNLYCL